MAFELVFHYTGKNDTGTEKTFKKIVGTPDEDVSLEKVVAVIARQLARRDIFVKDVTVYEYTKKKVRFKEVKNGLVLKDRKFLFDEMADGFSAGSEAAQECPVPAIHPHERVRSATPQVQAPAQVRPSGRVLRMEIYDPPRPGARPPQGQFTPGQKYPILSEQSSGGLVQTIKYVVRDDRGIEVTAPAEFFTAAGVGLGIFEDDPMERQIKKSLSHTGQFLEDRPTPVSDAYSDVLPDSLMRVPDLSALRAKGL